MVPGVVLTPSGVLDRDACAAVRDDLARAFAAGAVHVVIDARELVDVDNDGLRLLQAVARHLRSAHGGLVLSHVPPRLAGRFRLNGLADLLEIVPEEELSAPAASSVIVLEARRRARATPPSWTTATSLGG